jgi:hypothetical protein
MSNKSISATKDPRYNHPLTGKHDKVRASSLDWLARIQEREKELGYVICGAYDIRTGNPCESIPPEGCERCNFHSFNRYGKPPIVDTRFPAFTHGMGLNQFIRCDRCKDVDCVHRQEGMAQCVIEKSIWDEVMNLKDIYLTNGDCLQTGLLESVALMFIKRFRAEKILAEDGMVIDEIIGFDREGRPFRNSKPHPLLKNLSDINRELNAFAKTLQFSPEAQNKLKADERIEDSANVIVSILKGAHAKRLGQDE